MYVIYTYMYICTYVLSNDFMDCGNILCYQLTPWIRTLGINSKEGACLCPSLWEVESSSGVETVLSVPAS